MREALNCSALLRRIDYAERAGLLRLLDPEMVKTIMTMQRELTLRQMWAML